MADTKVTALTALTGANSAPGDQLNIVDVSDNTMAASGTNKSITRQEFQTYNAGTLTTDVKVLNLSATWNNAAVTFSGIKADITDTASNAASLLMDLQVGGVSKFKFSKTGSLTCASWEPVIGLSGYGLKYGELSSSVNGIKSTGTAYWGLGQTVASFVLGSGTSISFVNTTALSIGAVEDLKIVRDAANTLALRNGTNAQTFNIYNTYTDASNYERGFIRWSSNVAQFGYEAAGTGSVNRVVELGAKLTSAYNKLVSSYVSNAIVAYVNSAVASLYLDGSGGSLKTSSAWHHGWASTTDAGSAIDTSFMRVAAAIIGVRNGSTGGASVEFVEQTAPSAPSTNGVRIYAEDNGAGKTRLMALFATGAAQQIAIEP